LFTKKSKFLLQIFKILVKISRYYSFILKIFAKNFFFLVKHEILDSCLEMMKDFEVQQKIVESCDIKNAKRCLL